MDKENRPQQWIDGQYSRFLVGSARKEIALILALILTSAVWTVARLFEISVELEMESRKPADSISYTDVAQVLIYQILRIIGALTAFGTNNIGESLAVLFLGVPITWIFVQTTIQIFGPNPFQRLTASQR